MNWRELAHRGQRFRVQLLLDADFHRRGEQAHMAATGMAPERFQRRPADAAPGRGDGADEGRIVVRIGDQAQMAGDVLISALSKTTGHCI